MSEFGPHEQHLADNYRELSETTGESLESIAQRAEANAGDPTTAAKIRALHVERAATPKGRKPARGKAETAQA